MADVQNQRTAERSDKRQILDRLMGIRAALLLKFPFYGNLLMHLRFSLAPCGTACTDMERLIFDPEFTLALTDEQLEFVMMHEVMHCVLQHCVRGKGLNHYLFNIAADIVVNSNIMASMGVQEFVIDGEPAMHLAPNNKEGYLYSAEEVYDMLLKKYKKQLDDVGNLLGELEDELGVPIDSHDIWQAIGQGIPISEAWKENLKQAVKSCGSEEVPPSSLSLVEELEYEAKVDWRMVLQDFIQVTNDHYDYSFAPIDRRFTTGEFLMPAFIEYEGEEVDNLWFVVDTSGSISPEELTIIYREIQAALTQFTHLQGKLSFFNTSVTDPQDFSDVESLKDIAPVGGGGTSFNSIFRYLKENMAEKFPTAIIILTDGLALYPPKEAALEIPVLWILVENSEDAPWGVSVHI